MAYLPPNAGRMNVTFGGNTAGAAATVSTGTLGLHGGSNITLSQNGNNISINGITNGLTNLNLSAGATSNNLSNMVFSNSNGVSFGLNGSTITGTVATTYAASNHSHGNPTLNLTNLSGTTGSASNGLTLSLSAAAQTVQTQNLHNLTLSGNTAGVMAQVSSGTLTLAGGNNITLSQNGNAISIVGGAGGGGGAALSAGTQSVNTGTVSFANSNGITFGMSGSNQITASHNGLTSQSVQTQSRFNLSVGGNSTSAGAGYIQVSSGTMLLAGGNNITLSQNGNSVSIVGGAGGAGGGIALANSQTTYTSGTANLAVAGGAITIASTTGQSFNFSVPATSSLAATGALSISTNGATISLGVPAASGMSAGISNIGNTSGTSGTITNQLILAGDNNITLSQATGAGGNTVYVSAPPTSSFVAINGLSLSSNGSTVSIGPNNTMDYYQNMDRGASAVLGVPYATNAATLMLQRLNQENNDFAGYITANTVLLNMSASATSSAQSITGYIGIYSDNVTALSLLNSASTSWGSAANAGISGSFNGNRWFSFVSSQWSSAPAFQQGGEYVFGVFFRASGAAMSLSYIGQQYMGSNARSGVMGSAAVANATLAQGNFWNATYSASVSAFPATIASNAVTRSGASAAFMPHIILNNRYSGIF